MPKVLFHYTATVDFVVDRTMGRQTLVSCLEFLFTRSVAGYRRHTLRVSAYEGKVFTGTTLEDRESERVFPYTLRDPDRCRRPYKGHRRAISLLPDFLAALASLRRTRDNARTAENDATSPDHVED